jgi:excisionase family DNA binding protein
MEQNLTFEQLPKAVTTLIKEISELKNLLTEKREQSKTDTSEKLLSIQEAGKFLNLSVPTLYSKVSKKSIPVMKRGNRLYFSNIELLEYLKQGRKKSNAEIEQEAEVYLSNNKKGLKKGK